MHMMSNAHPKLAWVYALTINRYLKSKGLQPFFSLAQSGLSPTSRYCPLPQHNRPSKCKHLLKSIQDRSLSDEDAYRIAYMDAYGVEIDVINLLYANYLCEVRAGWAHFLNNYLILKGGWPLTVVATDRKNIFNHLIGKSSFEGTYEKYMISVIMPAFNNADTIFYAARSVLDQSHKNLELIIVDDCSADATKSVCREITASDCRVRYLRNERNSGAYVSRNRALQVAKGDYITVLDADDWSFPDRLRYQLSKIISQTNIKAHIGYYLRMSERGRITSFRICGKYSYDGALHKCLASLMIERNFMAEKLGYWDSVRFGADSELYNRIVKLSHDSVVEDVVPLLLALDRDDSLTNTGGSKLGGELRSKYAKQFSQWHEANSDCLYIDFPQRTRQFPVPEEMLPNIRSSNRKP